MSLIASTKQSLIVGLGQTGQSVARFLSKNQRPFAVADNRSEPPGLREFQQLYPGVKVFTGPFNAEEWQAYDEIILSPGIARSEPAIQNVLERGGKVIGDIELFARLAKAPIIAITGTNGKTTVTTLVGEMAEAAGLKVKTGGNLGIPALDLLDEEVELYVLELSSFQLESTESLAAHVAVILNITEDHMDRYASLSDYLRAKQRIFFNAKNVVINKNDPLTSAPLAKDVRYVQFGLGEPDLKEFGLRNIEGEIFLAQGLKNLIAASELKICGRHNLANALAALAIGQCAGFDLSAMLESLKAFRGVAHRCEWVAEKKHVRFFNDSKATNVGATLAAINGLADRETKIVLIAGGDGKGANFSPLKKPLLDSLRALVVLGKDGPQIESLIKESSDIRSVQASNMASAVTAASELARAGDIVLLSPACASLDMFDNYEDRGRQFVQAVEALN